MKGNKIHNSKNSTNISKNNNLTDFVNKIVTEPLKRDEFSMIRQFLRDKLPH
jgi:hypothetical protein